MAPKKYSKASQQHGKQDLIRSDSTNIAASQETEYWVTFVEKRRKVAHERRAKLKEEILLTNNDRMSKVKKAISDTSNKYDQEIRSMRRSKVEHLVTLNTRKHDIETRIDNSKMELERAMSSVAQQLQLALEGRVEELS